jgi:hypothetical protein
LVNQSMKRILLFACLETMGRPNARTLASSASNVIDEEYDIDTSDMGKFSRDEDDLHEDNDDDDNDDNDDDDDDDESNFAISDTRSRYMIEGGIISSSPYSMLYPQSTTSSTALNDNMLEVSDSMIDTGRDDVDFFPSTEPEEEYAPEDNDDDFDLDPSVLVGGAPVTLAM